MNSQNNDDSMNFSVIDGPPEGLPAGDFSVGSLLGVEEVQLPANNQATLNMQKSVEDVFSKIRKMQVGTTHSILKVESRGPPESGNEFMRDLSRMEKQLSFESEPYNIFEQGPSVSEVLQNNKSKTQSCLKLTKESTNKSTNKSTSKEECVVLSQYFGPLIIDFRKDSKSDRYKHEYLKYSKNTLKRSNNSSSGSQFSDFDYSSGNKKKTHNKSKSRSKDRLQSFFMRGKSRSTKNLLQNADFKKSKSKSISSKLKGVSKSHSNLKVSAQTENHSRKVFTEYYGTDIHIPKKQEPKFKKDILTKIKSRDKSSKSKSKVGLLSPRVKTKVPRTTLKN